MRVGAAATRSTALAAAAQIQGAGDVAPVERTDRLIVRFGGEGSLASAATVSVGLVDRRGKRLTDLPFRAEPGKAGAWLLDLPLTSISRGEYIVAGELASGPERSAAYIPLRVSQAF